MSCPTSSTGDDDVCQTATTSTGSSKMPPKTVTMKNQRDLGNKQYVASMISDIVQ
uniref:Uncharacterized protein n=1 Tax=Romanomermis culicivorax TaxID=13658 RepID=A0A915JHL8_ROMCU